MGPQLFSGCKGGGGSTAVLRPERRSTLAPRPEKKTPAILRSERGLHGCFKTRKEVHSHKKKRELKTTTLQGLYSCEPNSNLMKGTMISKIVHPFS